MKVYRGIARIIRRSRRLAVLPLKTLPTRPSFQGNEITSRCRWDADRLVNAALEHHHEHGDLGKRETSEAEHRPAGHSIRDSPEAT